MLKFIDYFF